jgi:hypothetical protein
MNWNYSNYGLINYIDTKAKCRHLTKNWTVDSIENKKIQDVFFTLWWHRSTSCLVFCHRWLSGAENASSHPQDFCKIHNILKGTVAWDDYFNYGTAFTYMGLLPGVAMIWSSTRPAVSLWDSFHLWDFYQRVAMVRSSLELYSCLTYFYAG